MKIVGSFFRAPHHRHLNIVVNPSLPFFSRFESLYVARWREKKNESKNFFLPFLWTKYFQMFKMEEDDIWFLCSNVTTPPQSIADSCLGNRNEKNSEFNSNLRKTHIDTNAHTQTYKKGNLKYQPTT